MVKNAILGSRLSSVSIQTEKTIRFGSHCREERSIKLQVFMPVTIPHIGVNFMGENVTSGKIELV